MDNEKKQIIFDIIEKAMEKKDQCVSLYFDRDGVSVNVYPYPLTDYKEET